jgi:predicted DNA-binding protein with PD1-like motif
MSKILIALDVSDEFITDIIDGAETGGIGYWASHSIHDPTNRTLTITDREDNKTVTISYDQIVNAVSDLVNRRVSISTHITDAITSDLASEDYGCHMDADCYDVIIQVALFGDVVYG